MSSFYNIPKDSKHPSFANRTSDAIHKLAERVQSLEAHRDVIKKQNPVVPSNTPPPANPPATKPSSMADVSQLTQDQIAQIASLVQPELQASGSAPIHAEQLLGQLAQPQLANIPIYPTVPSNLIPEAQDGVLFLVGTSVASASLY